jgi:hypothetical protein
LPDQEQQAMTKSNAMLSSTMMPSATRRVAPRSARARHEGLKLALGCAAAVVIALGLYLVAPTATRNAVVSAFQGFDQPFTSP